MIKFSKYFLILFLILGFGSAIFILVDAQTPSSAFCGDGIVQAPNDEEPAINEKCDDGVAGQPTESYYCTASCDKKILGWGWADNGGWISLSCANLYNCPSPDSGYHVQISTDNQITGWAWSDNLGWICFGTTCEGQGGITPPGGWRAYVDTTPVSGNFATEPTTPNTMATVGVGQPWTNVNNAKLDPSTWASIHLEGDPVEISQELRATNFGFSIPGQAIIKGVAVDVRKREGSGSGNRGTQKDFEVKMVVSGTKAGSDKSIPAHWSSISGGEVVTYGGPTDLWGNSLTPVQVNASDFGFSLKSINDDGSYDDSGSVYTISMKVYYEIP